MWRAMCAMNGGVAPDLAGAMPADGRARADKPPGAARATERHVAAIGRQRALAPP